MLNQAAKPHSFGIARRSGRTTQIAPICSLEKIEELVTHGESDYGSGGTIFNVQFAQNAFDVLADGARFRAQNHADLVIALASGNPDQHLCLARGEP